MSTALYPKWLNEKQVAKITGFSVSNLQKQRFCSKGIPYYKVGRSVRYNYNDILTYMETCKVDLVNI